jgi:tetratricopeptide (TPR) repeat protein
MHLTRAIAVLAVIGAAHAAKAQISDEQMARGHYARAQKASSEGRWQDALREFVEAHRVLPRPAFHYNIAICYEHLGQLDEAIRSYERYLAEDHAVPDRADVEAHVRELAGRLASRKPSAAAAGAGAAAAPGAGTAAGAGAAAGAGTTGGAGAGVAVARADLVAAPPTPTPIYRRGWFWGVVGASAAVVVVAVTLGVVLGGGSDDTVRTLPNVALR